MFIHNQCSNSRISPTLTKCQPFELITISGSREFIDSGLKSYTSYDYKLCVNNTFGYTCNPNISTATTLKSVPEMFNVFVNRTEEKRILFYWNAPLYSNGEIVAYRLFRNGRKIYDGLDLFYVESKRNLYSYESYKYEVMNLFY